MPRSSNDSTDTSPARGLSPRIAAAVLFSFVLGGLFLLSRLSESVRSSPGRLVVGALIAFLIIRLGIGYFHQLANPPPPDPIPESVPRGYDLTYVCEMCGLELAVMKVAKDKAPKHCGEAMILIAD